MSHSVSGSRVTRSSRRSILLEFLFPLVVMLAEVSRARRRDKDDEGIDVPMKCKLDHEDSVSCVPFHPTLRLNLGTRFLFSGGGLSHP